MRNFPLPPEFDLLPAGSMNPLVSRLGQPGADIFVGLGE
jgi:hypothetical protein